MTRIIKSGHMTPNWEDDFKSFPYVRQPLMDSEIEEWRNKGYDYVKSFSGCMYDNRNPMPDWVNNLELNFGLIEKTFTFYKMSTLEIMPEHVDHFNTYCRLRDVPVSNVFRVLIMLEDWQPGHYLEIDKVGYVNWKKGDWFMWSNDVPHAAANIGIEDRYTLQMTGLSVVNLEMPKLLSYNFLDLPNMKDYERTSYINMYINSDNPTYVYTYNGHINELADIKHTPESINNINELGLDIYLYEPVCSYNVEDAGNINKFNANFYSEFNSAIDSDKVRIAELDSIYSYIKNNNITNVKIHTCDYDLVEKYPYYNELNIITNDLFIAAYKLVFDTDSIPYKNSLKYKFINLNWRYTRHRNLISTFLHDKSVIKSWYFKCPLYTLFYKSPFNLNEWQAKYTNHFNTLVTNNNILIDAPISTIDVDASDITWLDNPDYIDIWPNTDTLEKYQSPAINNTQSTLLHEYYSQSFVEIITETRFFQPTANFSEKTLQAIVYKTPFILVAPPKTLYYFKQKFGIKTFNEYWDESYDLIEDHGDRLAAIFDIINYINNKSIEELMDMYNNMKAILEFNSNLITEYFKNKIL